MKIDEYVIAVRAPGSGIEKLMGNDWMVVSEPYGSEGLCKNMAMKLMPFITTKGMGDIAVYAYDRDKQRLVGEPRLVGRNGQATRVELLKDLTLIKDYDQEVKEQLEDLSGKFTLDGEYQLGRFAAQPRREPPKSALRRAAESFGNYVIATNARIVSATAIAIVVTFATAIVIGNGLQRGAKEFKALAAGKQVETMLTFAGTSSRHITAIQNGAMEVVRPNAKRPGYMQLVRLYPAPYGFWVDVLQDIREVDYKRAGSILAPHDAPWRTPEEIPTSPPGIHDPFASKDA